MVKTNTIKTNSKVENFEIYLTLSEEDSTNFIHHKTCIKQDVLLSSTHILTKKSQHVYVNKNR